MSNQSPLSTSTTNLYKDNLITTPYERVISIINEAIKFINKISKTQGKLIKELNWVIKVITSHSLYTYELKDDLIEKYSQENPDFKQFIDFVNEYNEDIIQMNKKNNIINSKSNKISNKLQIPSFKLKKKNFLFNSYKNSNILNRNKDKINLDNLTYSYSPNEILKNSRKLQLNSFRKVFQNKQILNTTNQQLNNYLNLKNQYKKTQVKSMDFSKRIKGTKLEPFSSTINVISNSDINYNNKYHSNKNLKEIVIIPDIYNNKIEIKPKSNSEKKKETIPRIGSNQSLHNEKITQIENQSKTNLIIPNIENIINENNINPNQILSKEFNIFNLQTLIEYDNVLPIIGKVILGAFGLINNNIIQVNKLNSFLYNVSRQYYKSTLYHNALHGADVTHTISLFFLNSEAEKLCDTNILDILSIFIAALGHDLGHPGLNNNFHINASTEIAITYNDKSCLENFHCCKLFRILKQEENDIFEKLNNEERKIVRKRMISEILSTDMIFHGKLLSVIKAKISVILNDEKKDKKIELLSKNPNNKFQEQQEILDFLIHSADLAHNTKLFNISIKWVELLSNEFWIQGDKEKNMNLPVSFLCDREGYDIPTSQIGFIKGFVIPMFEVLVTVFPSLNYTVDNAKINLEKWEELAEEHRLTGWSPKRNSNKKGDNVNSLSKRISQINFGKRISQINFGKRISQIKFGNKRISQVNIHFANKLIEKVKEKDSGNDLKLNVYTQKRNINS